MTIAIQKRLLWFLFLSGAMCCVIIAYVLVAFDPPPRFRSEVYFWVSMGSITAVVSAFFLRRCYRLEPARLAGYRQLSLVDLIATMFFAGFCMSIWQALARATFQRRGVVISIILAAIFLYSILTASSRGYTHFWKRYALAVCIFLFNCGLLACAWAVAIAAIVILNNGLFEGIRRLLDTTIWAHQDIEFILWRSGMQALIPGWAGSYLLGYFVRPDTQRAP